MKPEAAGALPDPTVETCKTCDGQGCEEGCGRCDMAYAGPDSHKVCRACRGQGR